MKAVGIHEFGSAAELLRYEEVPIPEPGPDELLINIAAASLNRADLALRKGAYRLASDELPVIPGREFAGIVAKLGPGVQELNVGQRVVACPGRGGYAEYALAKVSETVPIPDGIDSATAAAMPTVFLTSWFSQVTEARLKADDVLRGLGIDLAARPRPFAPYRGVDVVLEMVGGEIYQKSLQVLAPGGRLVSLGGAFGPVPDRRRL